MKWAEAFAPGKRRAPLVASNPATALALADDLARLIDDMMTRQVPWNNSMAWFPHVDNYWQLTLRFPEDRARRVAGDSCRSPAPSTRPRGATC